MQDQIDLSSFEDDDARAEALEAWFEHRMELYKLQVAAQLELAKIAASRSFGALTRTAIYVAGWAFFFSLILTPERQAQLGEWFRAVIN